jgi:DNA repair exonuclease SbcCD ATPase subunit
MNIKRIRFKNLKSVGGEWADFVFPETGFWRLTGKNGSGKSSLPNAMSYGLFGKNSDMRADSATSLSCSELINDINKEDMKVEIQLTNGYTILRGAKPDYFEIRHKDDNEINIANTSSKRIDQEYLEKNILGIDFQMFHKIVYLSNKAVSTPFLYMAPSQRKEFLETILDIRILYFFDQACKQRISSLTLEKKELDSKLSNLKYAYNVEKEYIQRLESDYKTAFQTFLDKKEKVDQDVKSSEEKIETLSNNIQQLEEKLEFATSQLVNIGTERLDDLLLYKNRLKEELNSNGFNIERLYYQKKMYNKDLEGKKQCVGCDKLKHLIGEFDESDWKQKMDELIDTKKKIIHDLEEATYAHEVEFKEIESHKENQKTFLIGIEKLTSAINNFKQQIQFEKDRIVLLQNIQEPIKPTKSLDKLNQLENDISTENIHICTLTGDIDQVTKIKKRIGDKSIHKEVIEQYIPIFQNKVNELLDIFMEDDPFDFKLELDSSFSITARKNGKETNLFKLSAGQQQSVHFAILFAIQHLLSFKNSITTSLFIDEILDIALDFSRVSKVLWYLKSLSKEKFILLISHNSDIQNDVFDKIIEAKKFHSFTYYEDLSL